MADHENSSIFPWTFRKYKYSISFSYTLKECSFSFALTFRNKCSFSFAWTFQNKCSFSFSCTFGNKRWQFNFLWTGSSWIYEENDKFYGVTFFKTLDYDLDKHERLSKYKDANLILCEKCNQKFNSIICFKCYDKVFSQKEEYPMSIGTCGSCFGIIENYDGCLYCKLKQIVINFINYLLKKKFESCDFILCLNCNRDVDRLLICFNCYNQATNDEEKNRMKFGKCKECFKVIKGSYGCLSCNSTRFKQDFDKWNSGITEIDELIRNKQISARDHNEILEWIPYDKFTDIKYIAEGGFAKVYSATWIDGYIINWDQESNNWKRSGTYKVAIKALKNSKDMSLDFLNEV
jgi:hypothetical protein